MRSAKSIGRFIGVLLFVQLVGLSLPFILMMPIASASYLENLAEIAFQVRLAVFLLFANGALTIGIAIAAYPILRQYSDRAPLWLFAFSIIWFAMQAADNAHIMSMLSLSEQYNQGAGSNAAFLEVLGASVRSTRRWVHYSELLIIDIWFLIFYGLLYRFRLVPRLLAGFGLLAVALHAAGIPLPVFLGYPSIMPLGFTLAISHLAVGAWLVARGFPVHGTENINTDE